jgi:hypothetical protein
MKMVRIRISHYLIVNHPLKHQISKIDLKGTLNRNWTFSIVNKMKGDSERPIDTHNRKHRRSRRKIGNLSLMFRHILSSQIPQNRQHIIKTNFSIAIRIINLENNYKKQKAFIQIQSNYEFMQAMNKLRDINTNIQFCVEEWRVD